jgi:LPXTG-motif cell wall-anchored protein
MHPSRDRHGRVAKHKRAKRRYRRITGFYHGYAEPKAPRSARGKGVLVPNAIAPHTAGLAAAAARPSTGVSIALIVPVLLALASLTLAGTALRRKRRLGTRG